MSAAIGEDRTRVSEAARPPVPPPMSEIGVRARTAMRILSLAPGEAKRKALRGAASAIREASRTILAENALDLAGMKAAGRAASFIDRATLDPRRIEAMARGVEEIADLPDPVGRILARIERPNGLLIERVSTFTTESPIGTLQGYAYRSPFDEIAHAALDSGWGDLSRFYRQFRHATGETPGRYRAAGGSGK